jgi:hypothetical protein
MHISALTPISTNTKSWSAVGGFTQPFASPFLSDILNASLDDEWGSFVLLCQQFHAGQEAFELVFKLALLAFRDDVPIDLVRVLVAFAIYPEFKRLELPRGPSFVQFKYRDIPSVNALVSLMEPHTIPFAPSDDGYLGSLTAAQRRKRDRAALKNHERDVNSELEDIARRLIEQWPCEEPSGLELPSFELVNLSEALESILPEWHRLYRNWQLSTWIGLVQDQLRSRRSDRVTFIPDNLLPSQDLSDIRPAISWRPCLSELLLRVNMDDRLLIHKPAADKPASGHGDKHHSQTMIQRHPSTPSSSRPTTQEISELHDIVQNLARSESTIKKNYAAALMSSIESFRQRPDTDALMTPLSDETDISQSRRVSQDRMHDHFRHLTHSLEQNDSRCRWLKLGGIWPAVTPIALLEELRSISPMPYDVTVKEALTAYGVSIAATQRLARMENSNLQGDALRLEQDRRNLGHTNWDPLQHPDWLLLEIDANITLRPNQSDVAAATIWPPSQDNSVLQMNMGEGIPALVIHISLC